MFKLTILIFLYIKNIITTYYHFFYNRRVQSIIFCKKHIIYEQVKKLIIFLYLARVIFVSFKTKSVNNRQFLEGKIVLNN
jgi:hypothetical protein